MGGAAAASPGRSLAGRASSALVSGVTIDSRTRAARRRSSSPFAVRDSTATTSSPQAAHRGAAAAVVDRTVAGPDRARRPARRRHDAGSRRPRPPRPRRRARARVVAVTGSSGKTTTKEMIAHARRRPRTRPQDGGQPQQPYGLPLTLLPAAQPSTRPPCSSSGMSAPGEIRELVAIARARRRGRSLNVAPVHLEFFESLDAIAEAKAEILEGLRARRHGGPQRRRPTSAPIRRAIRRTRGLVRARPRASSLAREGGGETGCAKAPALRADDIAGRDAPTCALPLRRARTSSSNFLAAAAAAHVLGLSPEAMAEPARDAPAGAPPGRGRTPRRRRHAPRRLLQLEPGRSTAAVARARPWRAAAGAWPSSATCSSWDRPARRCTARPARRSPGRRGRRRRVGPLARAIVDGARARGRHPERPAPPPSRRRRAAAAALRLVRGRRRRARQGLAGRAPGGRGRTRSPRRFGEREA